MSKEAALIIGGVVALLNAIVTVAGLGSFDDGLQWEDLVAIALPVLGALGIRQQVFSKETVDQIMAGTTIKPVPPNTGTVPTSERRRG